MQIIVKNKAFIKGLTKKERKSLRGMFTIKNPAIQTRIKMDLSIWNIPTELQMYEETDDMFIAPIGGLGKILDALMGVHKRKITPLNIADSRTIESDKTFFNSAKFTGKLRDYQKGVIDAMEGVSVGVIEAKTGSGKTVCFVHRVLSKKVNTLILVHTKELAEQTLKAFCKFSNLEKDDLGFIGSGKFNVKPITIGLLQTLTSLESKKFKKIDSYFGQIIADETHIIAANTYYSFMTSMSAKYKFGFSATPKREDGLTPLITWAAGPKIHTVPHDDLEEHLMIPEYHPIMTDYFFPLINTMEYQTMITHMAEAEKRNQLILDTYQKHKKPPSCFLCNRTSQVEILHKQLPDSIMLTSSMSKKAREKAMKDLESGKKKDVVSTYGLFSTGIDHPPLEQLFLCSPMRSKIKLKQAGGRLMRPYPGKGTPKIFDFVDRKIGLLMGQYKSRARVLKNL